jgi:hypothetical protein
MQSIATQHPFGSENILSAGPPTKELAIGPVRLNGKARIRAVESVNSNDRFRRQGVIERVGREGPLSTPKAVLRLGH